MTIYTKLTINGTQFNDAKNISVSKSVGQNNQSSKITINFDNYNQLHLTDIQVGQEIIFYAEKDVNPATAKFFAGTVTNVSFVGKGVSETLKVEGRDYTSYLQNNVVEPEVYTNTEISAIITDIMQKYAPTNITLNNVVNTGNIIPRITFNNDTIFDAIKKLSEYVDYVFYVDDNEDLHFKPKISLGSGVTIDSSNILSSDVTTDLDGVKNRIYVYGARQYVSTPTETFVATGTGSVFTLNFKPSNTSVTVNGVDQTGDLFLGSTSTPQSGVNYLVNYDAKQIIFVSGNSLGNSIPQNGSSVVVDYQVQRQIIKLAEDETSKELYGERTDVIQNENITDSSQARDVAKNQLSLKKIPLKEVNVTLQGLVGLVPGTTALTNIPSENIVNEELDVLQCDYRFDSDSCFTERVLKVKLSQRIKSLTDVLKELMLKIKALENQKTETDGIISRLISFTGSFGLGISGWEVKSRYIGHSFILGHPVNGVLGSPALGVDGQQIILGWAGSDWSIIRSGT